jgi:large subunit ribosomal protein L31
LGSKSPSAPISRANPGGGTPSSTAGGAPYRYFAQRREENQLRAVPACHLARGWYCVQPFMKENIHPKYVDSEIRCACGNVIKTRSTKPVIIVGICNVCHPFYTGQQKFVDTAGRVDKFQQRMAKTQAAQAAAAANKKKKR